MNREERVRAVVEGNVPDRIPVSVWYHFSKYDQDPVSLAEVEAEFVEHYDYDFIKMMPFGNYGIQDFGAKLNIYCQTGKPVTLAAPGIQSVEDYKNLKSISGLQGTYGKQVEFARLLKQKVTPNTPIIQTIFSPLTTLHKLTGGKVLGDIKEHPEEVKHALEVITEVTNDFILYNIEAGVDGFFFATQDARRELLDLETFRKFGETYDLQVMDSYAKKTWFNVVHIHGLDVYYKEIFFNYPAAVFNWHDRNTEPSLKKARRMTDTPFLAGIRAATKLVDGKEVRDDIVKDGTPEEIISHIHEAIDEVDGKGLMIGPGCVVAQDCSEENLRAVRKAVEY